jgi:hypothetical protein
MDLIFQPGSTKSLEDFLAEEILFFLPLPETIFMWPYKLASIKKPLLDAVTYIHK